MNIFSIAAARTLVAFFCSALTFASICNATEAIKLKLATAYSAALLSKIEF